MFRYLPEQASEVAPQIDWIHNWITDISVFFTVVICGAMLWFAFRYRKRGDKHHETPRIEGNNFAEVIWTVVPTIISIIVAYYGVVIYFDMYRIPQGKESEVVTINATGKKWIWTFQYSNGKETTGEFYVPVNKPVKVVLSSTDVLHSFFVPAMRVKRDAVPGQYSHVVFTPVKTGTYTTFCTEYCGTQHSGMLAKLHVVSQAEYDRWLNDRTSELARMTMAPAKLGRALYVDKGCNACHSLDGSRIVGPSFLKLFGSEREFIDGTTAVADENYLAESILYPQKQILAGYQNVAMPAFEGQLNQDELTALIAFIQAQDGSAPAVEEEVEEEGGVDLEAMSPVERGQYLYTNAAPACVACHSLDGSAVVGPSFKGLYGKQGELADGTTYVADDEYIKKSILNPQAEIVKGYQPVMVPYEGILSEKDLEGLIAYIKTLE